MEITPQIIQDFRDYYPEFSDDYTWTDNFLTRFLCEGDAETGSSRWGKYAGSCSFKKRGMFAYSAHKALIASRVADVVSKGGVPPSAAQVQSKSVADESISYAVQAPNAERASAESELRSTHYGMEFLRLRKRASMGPSIA